MVEKKPAGRSFGRRAGSVLAVATLVAGLFTWLPIESSGIIALAADVVDPSSSPAADPTPTPDPSPTIDPTPVPDPTPTPEPSPSVEPTPEPTPTPSPTPTPTPTSTPTPLPPGVVASDGGVVESGGIRLHVPAGAVNDPTRIEIRRTAVPDDEIGVLLLGFVIEAFDDASGATIGSFGQGITLEIDAAGWDLSGIDPTSLQIAELWYGSWRTIAAGNVDALVASTEQPGTFAVFGQLLAARVTLDQASDAPDRGRHRIEPGALLEVSISARPETKLASGLLTETIPPGWLVVDDGGGTFDPAASTVSWPLRSIAGGSSVSRTLRLRAPAVPYDGLLAVPSAFTVRLEQGSDRTDGPDLEILVAPRVLLPHVTAGRVDRAGGEADYLAPDRPLVGEPRFEVFRLRFEVANADSLPVRWSPQIEYRRSQGGAFVPLPEGENVSGIAFYAAPEWTRQPGGGTVIDEGQAVLDERTVGAAAAASEDLVDGTRSMGINPLRDVVLPPRSRTAVEFSVRATVDAQYLAAYEFRLTDRGETFAGAAEARVILEAEPALDLSPGQRIGVPAGERADASVTQIRFELTGPGPMTSGGGTSGSSTPAGTDQASLRFALVPPPGAITAAWVAEPIHGPSTSLVADSCAACHRSHTAAGPLLNRGTPPQLGQCTACHDGVTATDVAAGYTGTPENDPADRAYYRHEPTAFAGHISASGDGFAGQLNRHNECTDCHNPHNSTSTPSATGPAGWTGSGRVTGATSVAPTYGPSGPTYALVPSTALEYQLCLKCHSGYTQLPSNAGLPPSRYALDKGVEFDPANLSYHPVEAAGTNDTPAMELSLGGPSPYKRWSFTSDSTIRCVNCHADPRTLAEPTPVPADADLPVHASVNRGILIAAYKDRQLKGPVEAYAAADFALCYLCHAEAPFRDVTGDERPDTNFRYHGVHVSGANLLDHGLPGTNIDTANDGGGLATCAECHFRIHSTSFAVNGQPAGTRLVNFAPNVTAPTGGTITWRQKSATQTGTCAVKCHAQPHQDEY